MVPSFPRSCDRNYGVVWEILGILRFSVVKIFILKYLGKIWKFVEVTLDNLNWFFKLWTNSSWHSRVFFLTKFLEQNLCGIFLLVRWLVLYKIKDKIKDSYFYIYGKCSDFFLYIFGLFSQLPLFYFSFLSFHLIYIFQICCTIS